MGGAGWPGGRLHGRPLAGGAGGAGRRRVPGRTRRTGAGRPAWTADARGGSAGRRRRHASAARSRRRRPRERDSRRAWAGGRQRQLTPAGRPVRRQGGAARRRGSRQGVRSAGAGGGRGRAGANDNSPQQVVLSGARAALLAAEAHAREFGLRGRELDVTGAFHSPMMASAVPEFAAALTRVEVGLPRVPVISAVTAEPFDDVRVRLVEALTMPVRWRETLLALRDRGADRFLEVGPGRILTGLAKRTLADVELASA